MKDSYTENYKAIVKKKIKDLNKRNDILRSQMGRLHTAQMATLPKVSTALM